MDIEQLEALALSEDRREALAQLIPGTEDYYFHHCLAQQLSGAQGELAEVRKLLDAWVKRHGETDRVRQIRDRQALLEFSDRASTRASSLEHLRRRLGLTFDHQREVEGARQELPTRLDQALIGREPFSRDALAHQHNLDGFSDRALDWLAEDRSLSLTHIRALLSRLRRPDYPRLLELVLEELADGHSSGFGSLAIHSLLTLAQLDELAAVRASLLEDRRFIDVRLARMQPGPDVDLDADPESMRAHLDALWSFVEPLAEPFNSLKLHVLYHRLDFDRRHGSYDHARFQRYIQLPRAASYVADSYQRRHQRTLASFGQDFTASTLLPTVHDDTELVRDYLAQSFAAPEREDFDAYRPLLDAEFLRRVFAETKILAGIGDQERWYSLLDDPTYYGALKQRVDIDLAPDNSRYLATETPVELRVHVKNVPALVVKVFEINALAYFTLHGRAVDTSVDLDGLVANDEQVIEYADPPLRRIRRTLRFDNLTRPGTYVIELIGGGKSSRALIRKGELRYVERLGAAGHVLTILDEQGRVLSDASVLLGGRTYSGDERGDIRIPYGAGSNDKILLRHGQLCTVANFRLRSEQYAFAVGIHVEREQLIAGRNADVLVRAALTLNGIPVAASLLQDLKLTITSIDRHGTSSSVSVPLSLSPENEATHSFKVPDALQRLSFEVRAKVRSVTEQRDIELSEQTSMSVNEIDAIAEVAGLHLASTASGHVLYVLGKTGEPRSGLQVNLRFAHQDFRAHMQIGLQTDARGCIELGELDGIHELWAGLGSGGRAHWTLPRPAAWIPAVVNVAAGEPLVLPSLVRAGSSEAAVRSLLERRGGGYLRDCIAAVRVDDGAVHIEGLTPGDYELVLGPDRRVVQIRVGGSTRVRGWALSPRRYLQVLAPDPLRVADMTVDAQQIHIRVADADARTRVHVFATRFLASDAHAALDRLRLPMPELAPVGLSRCHYLSGRDIGDEYRYILERRRAAVFAGNMLERPSLLLNPWALRTTSTGTQDAKGGGSYDSYAAEEHARMSAPAPARPPASVEVAPTNNLEFLANSAYVALNLVPDEHGMIHIDRAALAGHQLLTVVAANALGLVSRQLSLPEVEIEPRDLRLRDGLDANEHFVKRKQRSSLALGEAWALDDMRTAKLETIDSLGKAHALLVTLSGNEHLREFEFVTRWPSLTPEEQRAKYSKYACHELSLFLARKQPQWFAAVVRPYLANKRDKTFLDHYLLEDDLHAYLEPWAYGRLNTLERILLAERIAGEGGPGARHVGDRFDLLPPDVEGDNAAFDTALQGSALDTQPTMLFAAVASAPAGFGAMASGGAPPPQAMPITRGMAMAPSPGPGGPPGAPPPPPAPAPGAPPRKASRARRAEIADVADELSVADDVSEREQVQRHFRATDKTEEWAENNYYRRKIAEQGPELIPVNAFWRDFADHVASHGSGSARPFLSGQFVRATSCFAEMLSALAVLDLPFEAQPPSTSLTDARLSLRANTPLIAFSEQIVPVQPSSRHIGVLVSQNYFRADDRYRYEGNERHDKYVEGELLVHTIYVCQVVLTNPSSSAHKLELLLQIPRGALPVTNGFATRDIHLHLSPHGTHAVEYSFYFPHAGEFMHFPVHVAKHGELVAFAAPTTLEVLTTRRSVDTTSWSHISQHGSEQELLAYLEANNLERLDLARIAWRMRERKLFETVLGLLGRRHVYHPLLWSYAIHHQDVEQIGVFLRQQEGYLRGCGLAIDSPLVRTNPVTRGWYQHLEYAPLINARAHQLGARRRILNDALSAQYQAFLNALTYQARPDDDQLVAAAYYALLQDRTTEGLALLDRVQASRVTGHLQLDYLVAYAALFRGELDRARELSSRWQDHEVDRWRKRFAALLAVLDEALGGAAQVQDADSREQEQSRLAAQVASFDFEIDGSAIRIHHQNLRSCTLSFYRMDIELLFSRAPFMKDESRRFSIITPNHSEVVELQDGQSTITLELPHAYRSANTIVEIVGANIRRSQANYAHDLAVQVIEPYGQLRVRVRASGQPLPRAYVKVYARKHGGEVSFYKDGYTDVRGAFDYASLSTNELDSVERFAMLVMTSEHGALIREAAPPQR
jgi:hypothetical protein